MSEIVWNLDIPTSKFQENSRYERTTLKVNNELHWRRTTLNKPPTGMCSKATPPESIYTLQFPQKSQKRISPTHYPAGSFRQTYLSLSAVKLILTFCGVVIIKDSYNPNEIFQLFCCSCYKNLHFLSTSSFMYCDWKGIS